MRREKMFDLEEATRNWRKALHKIESTEDGHIEELEAHLRDEIEDRISRGENQEEAFQKAAANIGTILELKSTRPTRAEFPAVLPGNCAASCRLSSGIT
jgi:hypothetical protein